MDLLKVMLYSPNGKSTTNSEIHYLFLVMPQANHDSYIIISRGKSVIFSTPIPIQSLTHHSIFIESPEALDIILPLEHSVVAPAMAALGSAGVLDGDLLDLAIWCYH